VFIRDDRTEMLTPNRIIYPSFWARIEGNFLKPIAPEQVAAAAGEILGDKPDAKAFAAMEPLTDQQVIAVLDKLAGFAPPPPKPADAIGPPTTAPATTPSSGEPVFVTGGMAYRRANGKLESSIRPGSGPYYWPLAHDVRGAQQALGARGCTECHAKRAPFFESNVSTASVIANASAMIPMHSGESIGSLRAFAATYPLRWVVIVIGYLSAIVLLLVYLKQKLSVIGSRS